MKTPTFPHRVKYGSVVLSIYRIIRKPSGRSAERTVYNLRWSTGSKRYNQHFKSFKEAEDEAILKSKQIAEGKADLASKMSLADASLLDAAKKIAGEMPLLAALDEWKKAQELTNGNLIRAAQHWKAQNVASPFTRIKVQEVVEAFIKAKERAGAEGERTYRAKLNVFVDKFKTQYLDSLSVTTLNAYLDGFQNQVTRNDNRKRIVTLCRWAQKQNFLIRGVTPNIESTERGKEKPPSIGIINSTTFSEILEFIRENHPKYLAAVVLAGFCGIRIDELHGKHADRDKRQLWEDINLEEEYVHVTAVKERTPAHRKVPLSKAAIVWLLLCKNRTGPICEKQAFEKIRPILKKNSFVIPSNCFRHSFISHRVAQTQNKPQVANEAGNSVHEIDLHYRFPLTQKEGDQWFKIIPVQKKKANLKFKK